MNTRATPTTPVDEESYYAAHQKVYPREVSGTFSRLRVTAAWVLLGFFYLLPWIPWGNRQAILFDLPARKFHLLGLTLWPQDFIFLAWLLVIAALSLFFFTAVAGRLWCGFACPQTVWTEVFLWMEKITEGDRAKRIKLDAAPWSIDKLRRKASKHFLWVIFALWTGFTFVGFFTPIMDLASRTLTLSLGGWETFWVLFYGFATWGNAGFLREQVCKYMCPYARFQSVMFDADTLIVTYDAARGEPRGTRRKEGNQGLGDCVDCGFCVSVCPTGIDIRKGLQIDCIACGACIDACDQVMDRMQMPRGLIRYSTENVIKGKRPPGRWYSHILRPRVIGYALLLVTVVGVMLFALAAREPLRVNVIREGSVLSRPTADGRVENLYRVKVFNMDEEPRRFRMRAEGLPSLSLAVFGGAEFEVPAVGFRTLEVYLRVDPEQVPKGVHDVRFTVLSSDDGSALSVVEKSTFLLR